MGDAALLPVGLAEETRAVGEREPGRVPEKGRGHNVRARLERLHVLGEGGRGLGFSHQRRGTRTVRAFLRPLPALRATFSRLRERAGLSQRSSRAGEKAVADLLPFEIAG